MGQQVYRLPNGLTVQASKRYAERMLPGAVAVQPEGDKKPRAGRRKPRAQGQ